MDIEAMREIARGWMPPEDWVYVNSTADGDTDRDARAWSDWDLIPRVLTGLSSVDSTVELGGQAVTSPIILAPSAAQGACDLEGELATRRAAAEEGLLAVYSFRATFDVETFAAAAEAPWWAQAYVTKDRKISDEYLRRCASSGASAIILTVDTPGTLADVGFRRMQLSERALVRGNYSGTADAEFNLSVDEIARTADIAGLPVWVKGVMTARDALSALDAGAAGIYVSNHGRRQLAGVAPTASVLAEIVRAINGRAPVIVDGGIRSGSDVAKALAMGAEAVAIGRPVPWALAAGGQRSLSTMLHDLITDLQVALAGLGAQRVSDLDTSMVRRSNHYAEAFIR